MLKSSASCVFVCVCYLSYVWSFLLLAVVSTSSPISQWKFLSARIRIVFISFLETYKPSALKSPRIITF